MAGNIAEISEQGPSFTEQVKISVAQVIDAMDVIGFQDQGKEKVAELIQDKFNELFLGNIDVIPNEWSEQVDIIMSVVEYLIKTAT